jgi:hypothetical protein
MRNEPKVLYYKDNYPKIGRLKNNSTGKLLTNQYIPPLIFPDLQNR